MTTSEVGMDIDAEHEFRTFVKEASPALMRTAYLFTGGDQYAAEDLLQTALAGAATKWHRIENPGAYVRRSMYNQQVSRSRRKWLRREVHVAELPEALSAVDHVSAVDLKLAVRRAMSAITARQRAVLVLRFFEDLPEAEVARTLGITVGTVRSTTHRALVRLREIAPELNDFGSIKETLP
jgi:RNA polymerase sigma-70 factor (sigma-E family)